MKIEKINTKQLKKDYCEVIIRPSTNGKNDRSFYETYHRKTKCGSYMSLTTHSKEERDEIMFDRSIELLLKYYPCYKIPFKYKNEISYFSRLSLIHMEELLGIFKEKVSNTDGSWARQRSAS